MFRERGPKSLLHTSFYQMKNILQKLAWIIFPPYEVKVTSEQISHFLAENAGVSRKIIERDAKALLRNVEKTIYTIRIEHMKPDHLALLLITNVIGEHLSLGNFHIYRGILNGVGNDMLTVFSRAVNAMFELGYHSKDDAAKDAVWIYKQVKNSG